MVLAPDRAAKAKSDAENAEREAKERVERAKAEADRAEAAAKSDVDSTALNEAQAKLNGLHSQVADAEGKLTKVQESARAAEERAAKAQADAEQAEAEAARLREEAAGAARIGTTGRGIGPAYEDKVGRRTVRVADLGDEATLDTRLDRLFAHHDALRRGLGAEPVDRDALKARLVLMLALMTGTPERFDRFTDLSWRSGADARGTDDPDNTSTGRL